MPQRSRRFYFAVFGSAPALAQQQIIHIGAGHPYSLAQAINNGGQVVGVMNFPDDEGRFHAYVWEDGVLLDLDPAAAGGSHALRHQRSWPHRRRRRLRRWPRRWRPVDLTDRFTSSRRPSSAHCAAVAINDRDLIVGSCSFPTETVPVFWRNGVLERMAVPSGLYVNPIDVNESGVVVGGATRLDGTRFPFVWVDGVLTGAVMRPTPPPSTSAAMSPVTRRPRNTKVCRAPCCGPGSRRSRHAAWIARRGCGSA